MKGEAVKGEARWVARLRSVVAAVVVAALFVPSPVATSPAGAVQGQADVGFADGNNPACPDPDAVARQAAGRFLDIDADHVHADEIGCIAYYGITTGTGDGTRFSPARPVLRWEMALFMVRTLQRANVGGIPDIRSYFNDLGDPRSFVDIGDLTRFVDIGDLSPAASEAVAIVSGFGIMRGREWNRFAPDAAVRRDEMAVHLVRLLERLTETDDAVNVVVDDRMDRESFGRVTLTRRDGTTVTQDDSFPDLSGVSAAERHAIGAIYELGVTAGRGDGTYHPDGVVRRDQMATFLVRALGHSDLRPDGPITLRALRPSGPTSDSDPDVEPDVYAGDPLRLIANASGVRTHSLPGSDGDILEVWLCDSPGGTYRYSTEPGNPHNPSNYADKFSGQVVAYFDWLSGGRYRPVFRSGGVVEVDNFVGDAWEDTGACMDAIVAQDLERWTQIHGVIIVVDAPLGSDDLATRDGIAGLGGCSIKGSFPNGRLVMINGSLADSDNRVGPLVLAHEMGHALCWPHSSNLELGMPVPPPSQSVYGNPMDIMSSGGGSLNVGTIAINRYAAGWIPTSQVEIHELGTTKRYELKPIGRAGTQLLIVPYQAGNTTHYRALGARVRENGDLSWDAGIVAEGVEIYDVDQSPSACGIPEGHCQGAARRTVPVHDSYTEFNWGRTPDHVMQVGTGFSWTSSPSRDQPGVAIEVISRSGDTFTVEVKPYTGYPTGYVGIPSGDLPGATAPGHHNRGKVFEVEVKKYTVSGMATVSSMDSYGGWTPYSTLYDGETEIIGYRLRSENPGFGVGLDNHIGWIHLRCYGSEFDPFVLALVPKRPGDHSGVTRLVIFGIDDTKWIQIGYRAGTADVVFERGYNSHHDVLFPRGDSSDQAFARSISDNPGPFLFRWQHPGKVELPDGKTYNLWKQLRFADTTGAKAALASLACYDGGAQPGR